jgi:hypothetical protein
MQSSFIENAADVNYPNRASIRMIYSHERGSDMKVKQALTMLMVVLGAALVGCESREGPAEQAGKQIDQAAEQAGDTIDQAVEKAGEEVEEAGDTIREKTSD